MLTAFEIVQEAVYRAKVPGYTPTFGIRNLNATLSDLCQHHDFALARGTYNFNFDPSLSSTIPRCDNARASPAGSVRSRCRRSDWRSRAAAGP